MTIETFLFFFCTLIERSRNPWFDYYDSRLFCQISIYYIPGFTAFKIFLISINLDGCVGSRAILSVRLSDSCYINQLWSLSTKPGITVPRMRTSLLTSGVNVRPQKRNRSDVPLIIPHYPQNFTLRLFYTNLGSRAWFFCTLFWWINIYKGAFASCP